MTSQKEDLARQIDELNKQIAELRKLGRKKEIVKEKQRLMSLMTSLILELASLDQDPEKSD